MPNLPNVKTDPDLVTVPEDVQRFGPRRWAAIDPEITGGSIYVDYAHSGWRPYVGPSHPGVQWGYNPEGRWLNPPKDLGANPGLMTVNNPSFLAPPLPRKPTAAEDAVSSYLHPDETLAELARLAGFIK